MGQLVSGTVPANNLLICPSTRYIRTDDKTLSWSRNSMQQRVILLTDRDPIQLIGHAPASTANLEQDRSNRTATQTLRLDDKYAQVPSISSEWQLNQS